MERDADLSVIPIEQIKSTSQATTPTTTDQEDIMVPILKTKHKCTLSTSSTKEEEPNPTTMIDVKDQPTVPTASASDDDESMEKSETIWPFLRSTRPHIGIHIPLTFSLRGSYGRYGTGAGVIGSSYASVDTEGDGLFKLYGKSGLAGSSYGSYGGIGGTRIYGNGGGPAWSGWGNGKWGHYGKG
ncbi:uncharacterized protein LOC126374462 [Pectinophora gossypiella]|uniref:uncharacterized protein LOC126374462 n=1 Tax=Pectinophora gossypiella TaxID=13191 RepID=UPI00214E3781|nr:uncharacterized protein LOC126374462 [Pectinophora gossypiella]XP_049877073.1 uncharacterized protein LOC126374462 [Pectinophora gossypiella]XP_049877074.1 uncharacterized protein LOC126374462 [Pectinophora gossypiella]